MENEVQSSSPIPAKHIANMVEEYYKKQKIGLYQDALTDWCLFKMGKVEAFLTRNGYDRAKPENFGLRIYLGIHVPNTTGHVFTIPDDYLGKLTTILVLASRESTGCYRDILEDPKSEAIIVAYDGEDIGHLCPPKCKDLAFTECTGDIVRQSLKL